MSISNLLFVGLAALATARPIEVRRSSNLRLRGGPSPDVPLDDKRLKNAADRTVEQVHVNTGVSPESAMVIWVSSNHSPTSVTYSAAGDTAQMTATGPPGERYSFLLDPSAYYPVNSTCQGSHNYTNPECFYTSGEVHIVELSNLTPGTDYSFTVAGDSETFRFSTGPAVGPDAKISFGIIGDLGQTENSTHTVAKMSDAIKAGQVDQILLAGDLSYADGYAPRWDTYARIFEYLFANVKTAYVGGNHEVSNGGENWLSYKARYPNQHVLSGSDSFLWHSFEAGPAHVVMLCSYADFSQQSAQYEWLAADLAKVDRSKTPWLLAVWHTPWYTSNAHHPMTEGSEMRGSMEALMLHYEVDVVFNGHVHAYERTNPVAFEKVDCKAGIHYITIGDGGNREEFATPWVTEQPDWSAIREYAYGHGQLHIENSTHALWQWVRDDDPWNPAPKTSIGDQAYFVRQQSHLHGVDRC
jgi:hypothetical protein